MFFLPKSGVESITQNHSQIKYQNYKISTIFGLKDTTKPVKTYKDLVRIENLILRAIYGNNKRGFIVFAQNSTPSTNIILGLNHSYKGYKLTQIKQKSVILQKNGKDFELVLKDDTSSSYITRIKSVQTAKRPKNQSDAIRAVRKKDIMHYAKNFDQIWKNIAIDEIKKDGKIDGFKIMSVNQSSIFGKLGLQKGDIIKSVNNKVMTSYADAFKIYNNIQDYEGLKIQIIRNKQIKELEYEIF